MAKFLVNVDLNDNQLLNAAVQNVASDPGTGVDGQLIFNTTSNNFKYYNGSSWVTVGSGSGGDPNQNAFSNFAVSGQSTVSADSTTDTVTFEGGSNITITTNATNDTISFAATDTNTDVDVSKANLTSRLAEYNQSDTVNIGDSGNDTNVVIRGNLTVNGTTTSVNSNEVNIGDSIILLNSDETGTPTQNAGVEVERGTAANVQLRWDEADDDWEFEAFNHAGTPALTTYKISRSVTSTIGGATQSVITHNLGTRDVLVQLYDASSYETVYADVTRNTINQVTIDFATAPATNDVRVLITTIG